MPNVNLLPPELRGPEEKLQRKLQKQQRSAQIKYVRPAAGPGVAKQPSVSFWQRLLAKPVNKPVIRPSAKAPLPMVPVVKKLAVKPIATARSAVVAKPRQARLGFWRWLLRGSGRSATAKFTPPVKSSSVGKAMSQSKYVSRPSVAKAVVRPVSRQSFWQYFFRLKSEKLLPAPQLTPVLPPINKKSRSLAPFDWVSFFQTFVYLLIIIIILSFYLILRTTDNYLLRRDFLVQQQLNDLRNRVISLEQGSSQPGQSANQAAAESAKNKDQLKQVEIWSVFSSNIVDGIQISNIELDQNQLVKVTGQAAEQNILRRQELIWQRNTEITNWQLAVAPPTGEVLNFIITFNWRSTILTP